MVTLSGTSSPLQSTAAGITYFTMLLGWLVQKLQKCMQTHAGRLWLGFDLWPFDLRVCACWGPVMVYTDFGADSSSRFPFRVRTNRQTNRQTDATERPTHAGGYTAVVGNSRAQKHTSGKTQRQADAKKWRRENPRCGWRCVCGGALQHGKPSVAYICISGSGNIAFSLKIDTDVMTLTFDLLIPK